MAGVSYDQERDAEQLRQLTPAIDAFVAGYRVGRPTVVLLPGGEGSALRKARQPFVAGGPSQAFSYDTIWIAPALICDALGLAMSGDADADQHIVIAGGPVRVLGSGPYDRIIAWGADPAVDYNVFVYGWDWRRSLDHEVAFFNNQFLPALQEATLAFYGGGADPLADFTVVGHSIGGLLVHLWLAGGGPLVNAVRRTVTVATPFYGYCGMIHRYFAGEPLLNGFSSPAQVAAALASMPGLLALMPMPHDIWLRDKAAFAADDYPLNAYPMVDSANPSLSADPYAPVGNGGLVRYPPGGWFTTNALAAPLALLRTITTPLPRAIAAKAHNWRGVRTSGATVLKDTCWRQSWQLIPPTFDPDTDPDPITDLPPGEGDGTIPAWSAQLARTPQGNRRTVTGSFEHMFLMEDDGVLNLLEDLIGGTAAAKTRRHAAARLPPPPPVATPAQAQQFVGRIRALQPDAGRRRSVRRELGAQVLTQFDQPTLQAIVRRIMADILKR